ncbi:hypothetical protein J3F84DRAFT_364648, partial [Trichoderma pleuroticola]
MGRWPAIGFTAAALDLGIQQRYGVGTQQTMGCLADTWRPRLKPHCTSCQSNSQTTEQAQRKRAAHHKLPSLCERTVSTVADRGNEEPCQHESKSARHLGISSGPCRTLTHMASGKANRDDTETLARRLYHPPRGYPPTAACTYLLLLLGSSIRPCH